MIAYLGWLTTLPEPEDCAQWITSGSWCPSPTHDGLERAETQPDHRPMKSSGRLRPKPSKRGICSPPYRARDQP